MNIRYVRVFNFFDYIQLELYYILFYIVLYLLKMKICVFCSSSNSIAPGFIEMGKMLGKKIAEKGYTLVYGGATGGLMDAVAEGASGENGEIIGVIPEIIIHSDRLSQLPTQQIVTTDMSERKKRMKEMADAFVVLPGGFGTLDEMFDVIASATVGEHKKPLICLNYNGFYNRLIQLADEMRTGYFIPKEEKYKPIFVNSVEECLERIEVI